MKELENREDISKLVNAFYAKIRKDELLGPIFNNQIPNEKWPMHLEKLTNFWVTNLLGVACFKGSPTRAHIEVDFKNNYTIEQVHFGKWIQLWFTTIDELYKGNLAERAKNAARRMSTGQYMAMWNYKPK